MYKIIPMLTDPASHGLPGFRSFDVIAPSLPGFGFSQAPRTISVYWFSGNAASTLRIYKENAAQPLRFDSSETIIPPLCYASFPKEIVSPPREWVERVFKVVRWTEMPLGGHFAALEQPAALARDIHESFAVFR